MKKWKIITVMAAASVLAMLPAQKASAHYDTAYYHEEQQASDNADWMSGLRDNARLSELSIPGTHDSMSHRSDLSFVDNTRTQTMNLQQQLESGIRYLDIRVKYTDTGFPLHHGIVYLGYDFEDVLKTVQSFLRQHPGETIIMRFKQENSSASDAQMKAVFDTYYSRYKSVFWSPTGEKDPALESMRGRLVLLSDVMSLNVYGLNYRDVDTQDYYDLGTNWDLYSKWEKVKEHAKESDVMNSGVTLNHLSAGSAGVMPYFVASGHSSPQTGAPRLLTGLTEPAFASYYPDFPRVGQAGDLSSIAFEGINTLFANLVENKGVSKTGIVAADFPGRRLIDGIIRCNDYLIDADEMGRYKIYLVSSPGMVVDNNMKSDGKTSLWKWNGQQQQQWDLIYEKGKNAYQIVSVIDGKVLTWDDANGGRRVVAAENTRADNQYWKIEDRKTLGYLIRSNKDSNYMLRYDGNASDGASLSMGFMDLNRSFFQLVKL